MTVSIFAVVMACGAHQTPTASDDSNDGDTTKTDSSSRSRDSGGDEASTSDGTYKDGIYTCCGRGKGLSCCTAAAGLMGYEVLDDGGIVKWGDRPGETEANCFQYGGTTGACAEEGELVEQKDICSTCCDDLKKIESQCAGGPCTGNGDYGRSLKICTHCGDGICGKGESSGNCPEDCAE